MTGCEDCARKERSLQEMAARVADLTKELDFWQKVLFDVQGSMRQIYMISRDAQWHPSNYAERGADGAKSEQPFIDVQMGRAL